MYKITSQVFGQVVIQGKQLAYKGSVIVKDLDTKTTDMAESKIVKIQMIEDNKAKTAKK